MIKSTLQNEINGLLEAFTSFEDPKDFKAFLTDLCTPGEIDAMSSRWCVAKMIRQGISYREIAEKTGVSTATITRVARCLNEGSGYQKALDASLAKELSRVAE